MTGLLGEVNTFLLKWKQTLISALTDFFIELESAHDHVFSRHLLRLGAGSNELRLLTFAAHNQSQLTLCYVSACTVIKLAKLHTAIGSGFSAEPIAELHARF